jgi:two-component system NarL family response regulator
VNDANAPQKKIRVMVVDDHLMVRKGILALLRMEPTISVVAEADDGAAAVELYGEHRPDVTLMDLRMPKKDGVGAITAIKREFPDSRFVVLTTFEGDEDILRALQAGAQGYLLKNAKGDLLIDAIRTVAAGGKHVAPELLQRVVFHAAADPGLTAREREVLELMARGKTNLAIARALDLSEATVKWHVNNVTTKLDVRSRTEAVLRALKRGLVTLD